MYLRSLVFVLIFCFSSISFEGLQNRLVYIFGDSHSEEFIGIPECKYFNLGSITMHRVGRDSFDFVRFDNYPIADGDAVVFAFGQIDVGWHVCKIRDRQKKSLDDILERLAKKYIKAILTASKSLPKVIKIVYSVTPPSNNTNIPHIPYVGTLEERVHATKLLNSLLKSLCLSSGIEFLDVYDDYSYPNGVLRTELSDQSHHILHVYNQVIQQRLYEILDKYP